MYYLVIEKIVRYEAETKKEVEANNVKCFAVQGDVTNFKDLEQFVKQIVKEFGNIDVLVNNAGMVTYEMIPMVQLDVFKKMWEINVIGTFNLLQIVSRIMGRQKSGSIINMASIFILKH